MNAHAIFEENERGEPINQIAWTAPAKPEDVQFLLDQPTEGLEGRSPWFWVRLRDGTLMLATFPQGDAYMQLSDGGVCDWEWADA